MMMTMMMMGLVGSITYRERREAGQGLRKRRSTTDDVIQVFRTFLSRYSDFIQAFITCPGIQNSRTYTEILGTQYRHFSKAFRFEF